jgi:hypothetical protein
MKVAKEFQGMTLEELAVYYSEVIMAFDRTSQPVHSNHKPAEPTHDKYVRNRQAA